MGLDMGLGVAELREQQQQSQESGEGFRCHTYLDQAQR